MTRGVWRSVVDLDADVVHVFREETAAFHLPEPDCPCDPELQLRDRGNGQVVSF